MKQTIVSMITFLLATLPTSAGEIAGRAIVVDGDTIAVEGTDARIRLWGIDAPEGRQTCNNARGEPYTTRVSGKRRVESGGGTKK